MQTLSQGFHRFHRTRGKNIFDLVYTSHKEACNASPLFHIGFSDHTTLMLISAYRPRIKAIKSFMKQAQIWSAIPTLALQDCFDTTEWNMFKRAATYNDHWYPKIHRDCLNLHHKCIDDVTNTKLVTIRAHQMTWQTGEVHRLLRAQNTAFKAGDAAGLKTAWANLSHAIKRAKQQYTKIIRNHLRDSRSSRSLWQGIQTITNYRPQPQTCDSDTSMLKILTTMLCIVCMLWHTKHHNCRKKSPHSTTKFCVCP